MNLSKVRNELWFTDGWIVARASTQDVTLCGRPLPRRFRKSIKRKILAHCRRPSRLSFARKVARYITSLRDISLCWENKHRNRDTLKIMFVRRRRTESSLLLQTYSGNPYGYRISQFSLEIAFVRRTHTHTRVYMHSYVPQALAARSTKSIEKFI